MYRFCSLGRCCCRNVFWLISGELYTGIHELWGCEHWSWRIRLLTLRVAWHLRIGQCGLRVLIEWLRFWWVRGSCYVYLLVHRSDCVLYKYSKSCGGGAMPVFWYQIIFLIKCIFYIILITFYLPYMEINFV